MRPRALVLALALLGCAGPLRGATSFQPAYQVSGGAVPQALPSCVGRVAVVAEDARPTPSDAGRRFEEEKPSVEYPIQMTGDAAAWLKRALETNLARAGSPGTGRVSPVLSARLVQLRLEEKTFHNAEFSGSVAADVSLAAPGGGAACWTGRLSGTGTNYGRAGNPENYQETMNRALEKGLADLVATPAFRDALCACTGG